MKVLLIGLGSIGKKHVHALKSIDPHIEITALRSRDQDTTVDGVQSVTAEEQIDYAAIDFAVISNPTYLHGQTVSWLLDKKVPMFIEKPVFHSLEFDALVKQIEDAKLISYVACNLRFLESLEFLKQSLTGKRINEVNSYCGSFLPEWRPGQDVQSNYSAHAELGGGVHLDLIHEIDYACWLFGLPVSTQRYVTSTSSLQLNSIDYAHYLLKYESFTMSVTLNYFRKDAKRALEVVCEDGTYTVDLLKNSVDFMGQTVFSSSQKIADTYEKQLRYFIQQWKTGISPMNQVEEAYEILKICLKED